MKSLNINKKSLNINKQSIKNKIIFIYYINVGNLSNVRAQSHMNDMMNMMSITNDYSDVIEYFIPVVDQETKIEMLNPSLNCNNTEEIVKKLEELNETYKMLVETHV